MGKKKSLGKEVFSLVKENAASYMMYLALVVIMLIFQFFSQGRFLTATNISNLFNQAVRSRILNIEGEIATGDKLMIVKNNYFWTDENKEVGFIANGDMAEIMKIARYEEMYGFRFADVELSFPDYPDSPNLEVKILLDTLNSESASLTEEENMRLRSAIEADYMDIPERRERYRAMKKNPWFNALQVKFAYALTCHKTQGGQWKQVFVDSSLNLKDELEKEDIRWLYTAITRAQKQLYFVNFKEEFFYK